MTKNIKMNNSISFVTEAEAAKMMGVSQKTLQAWRLLGKGPTHFKISPKIIRYNYTDLVQWLNDKAQ